MEENNRGFKVTGSLLVRLSRDHPLIDMRDCNAYIMAETANTYSVRFYIGTPYIVNKEVFMANTIPGTTKDMNYHEIHDITLLLGDVPKKTFRGVFFGNEDQLSKTIGNALSWFNLKHGVHWDNFITVLRHKVGEIKNNSNQITAKEMAKKATTTEVATTAQSEFELRSKEIGLPTVPSTMVLGGVTFSEELIKKQIEEVKKLKVEAPLPEDTREIIDAKKKVYDEIIEKKKAFVKTRTAPEKFRQEITKPINAWTKELKTRTDGFGDLAKEGEQYCIEQAKIYEDWEAEQLRIKENAEAELVKTRTLELQSVLGIVNPASQHWTFKHNPMLVEHHEIINMDDSEWNGIMKELEDSFKAAEEQAEADRQALINAQAAVKTARLQMLQLMGYAFDGNFTYSKNGHAINDSDILKYQDAEWMNLIQSHNTPKEATNPFTAGVTSRSPSYPTNPFAGTNTESNPFTAVQPQGELAESTAEKIPADAAENVNNLWNSPAQEMPNAFSGMAQMFGATTETTSVEEVQNTVLTTEWPEELPFVEFVLTKSTLRLYPIENQTAALEIPNRDERHMYSGVSQENGLCYIMYKNV